MSVRVRQPRENTSGGESVLREGALLGKGSPGRKDVQYPAVLLVMNRAGAEVPALYPLPLSRVLICLCPASRRATQCRLSPCNYGTARRHDFPRALSLPHRDLAEQGVQGTAPAWKPFHCKKKKK